MRSHVCQLPPPTHCSQRSPRTRPALCGDSKRERVSGLEPELRPWKGLVQPLHHTRTKASPDSRRRAVQPASQCSDCPRRPSSPAHRSAHPRAARTAPDQDQGESAPRVQPSSSARERRPLMSLPWLPCSMSWTKASAIESENGSAKAGLLAGGPDSRRRAARSRSRCSPSAPPVVERADSTPAPPALPLPISGGLV